MIIQICSQINHEHIILEIHLRKRSLELFKKDVRIVAKQRVYPVNRLIDIVKNYVKQVYRPIMLEQTENSQTSNPELYKKYFSIYNELKGIELSEVIQLFLEEIDENQKNRERLLQNERAVRGLQEEVSQLKGLLQRKRQAISSLCQTESNNLNLIECLQLQLGDKLFNPDAHFLVKYRELEAYMNEYIASTNEAQEEFRKNYHLLKNQQQRLEASGQYHTQQLLEYTKLVEFSKIRQQKLDNALNLAREKETTLMIRIQNLEQENQQLKKTLGEMQENLREKAQFSVELTKQNKELSNELDFIRQKINENQNISRDLFEKLEQDSDQSSKLTKELQKTIQEKERLEILLTEAAKEREDSMNEKRQLLQGFEQLCKQAESLKEDNQHLMEIIEQREVQADRLRKDIQLLQNYQQELLVEYSNEKESKSAIKAQLIELAEQVKFMESTYRKEINQNERIKQELQKFWEKKDKQPLTQISMNNYQQSGSRQSRTSSFAKSPQWYCGDEEHY